jgi:hypothetical protein
MIVPSPWRQVLDFFGTMLVIEPSHGQLSSGAGLLLVRQFDERIGLTRDFAEAMDGPPRHRPHGAHLLRAGPRPRRWQPRRFPGPGRPRQPIGLRGGAPFWSGR